MAFNSLLIWSNIHHKYMGYPIYIATQEFQHKRHHKKRINKKWRKRYGCTEINKMPHDEIIMADNGDVWMTKRTFENLKKSIVESEKVTISFEYDESEEGMKKK